MRPLRAAILTVSLALAAPAFAEPVASPGYTLEIFSQPGAIFAGLARDGDSVLVTNLADGRLYRRGLDGTLVAFGPVLPHGGDVIGDPTGPYRAEPSGDGFIVAQGWTPADADPGPYDHALLRIDKSGGISVVSDDFWNPFDFAIVDDTIYVVDAALNSIERIGVDGSGKTTVAAFQRQTYAAAALQTLSPTEFPKGTTYDVDAVPTGIAIDGGRAYVSLFGGFPFIAGAGTVVSFPLAGPGPVPQIDVSGLNAPVDIAWMGGQLLILEHGTFDQATGFRPGTGRLIAFDNMLGGRKVILDGLTRPASVLVTGDEILVSELGGNLLFLKPRN